MKPKQTAAIVVLLGLITLLLCVALTASLVAVWNFIQARDARAQIVLLEAQTPPCMFSPRANSGSAIGDGLKMEMITDDDLVATQAVSGISVANIYDIFTLRNCFGVSMALPTGEQVILLFGIENGKWRLQQMYCYARCR